MGTKPTTSNAACWFAFLGMAYFAIGGLSAGQREGAGNAQPPKKADALPAFLKVRLDAAKKNYGELSNAMMQAKQAQGRLFLEAKPEEVCTWSVRWLNAERDMSDKKEDQIAALESHLRRTKELQKKLDKMVPQGLSQVDATAAAWYVAEAEVWLAKAK